VSGEPAAPVDAGRRAALRLLAAVGALPVAAGWGALGSWLGCAPTSSGAGRGLQRAWADPEAMAALGRVWLEQQAQPASEGPLLAELGWPAAFDAQEAGPIEIRAWLAEQHRRDWLEGRQVAVAGFRLSASEVRVYALAALWSDAGRLVRSPEATP